MNRFFVRTENDMTSTVNLTRVDIADIVSKSASDSELLSNYYLLVSDLLVSMVWYKCSILTTFGRCNLEICWDCTRRLA